MTAVYLLGHAVDIAAHARLVWATWMDVERWPEWNPGVWSVTPLDARWMRPGARYRIEQAGLPTLTWTILDVVPPYGFAWSSRLAGGEVQASHQVIARGHGTRAALQLRYHGLGPRVLARFTAARARRRLAAEGEMLKRHLETRFDGVGADRPTDHSHGAPGVAVGAWSAR